MKGNDAKNLHLSEYLDRERLKELLEASHHLSGLVIHLLDEDGSVYGRIGQEKGCRLEPADFEARRGRHLIPAVCIEKRCPFFRNQYFSSVNVVTDNVGLVVCCSPFGYDPRNRIYVEFLSRILSDVVTAEYEISSITKEILDKYEEINLLYELSTELSKAKEIESICEVALEHLCKTLKCGRAVAAVDEKGDGTLRIRYASGCSPSISSFTIPPDTSLDPSRKTIIVTGRECPTLTRLGLTPPFLVLSLMRSDAPASDGNELLGLLAVEPAAERPESGVSSLFRSDELRLAGTIASQTAIAVSNRIGIERRIEAEKLARDVELARNIQLSFLPTELPEIEGYDVSGTCIPARRVGGDYYDCFRTGEGRTMLLIADVSGHHMGSAILMGATRTALRSHALAGLNPARILGMTNQTLIDDLERTTSFVSVFMASLDERTGILTCACAGHNPPLLLRRSGGACEQLSPDGLLVGILPDATYEECSVVLEPGDVLLLYTDGIVEAADENERMYGLKRLEQTLRKHSGAPADRIVEQVLEEVRAFCGRSDLEDDVTLLVLKRL